jgi:hypothetical protein
MWLTTSRLQLVSRKLIAGLVVLGGILGLMVLLVVIASPSGRVAPDEDGTFTLELPMLVVPVADEDPVRESPAQYVGVPHPGPKFDTSDLGPDLNFRQDPADLKALDPKRVLRAVYLGHDQGGEPYYIWHVGSPDFRRFLGQIVADFGSIGRFGSSYGTLATGGGLLDNSRGQSIEEMGLTTGSLTQSSGEAPELVAEWHGLPREVAAVVFYWHGEALGWQNPVSGTAALQVALDNGSASLGYDIEMVALNADGQEWNRYP